MKNIIVLILVILFINGIFATGMEPSKDIYVFIRVDDLFMLSSNIQPQEIDAFLDIAEKHGARTVLATIPRRLIQNPNHNGIMAEQILDYSLRGHEIAQHGYDHRCPFTGRSDHDLYTPDIDGYTREERFQRIRKGRAMLEAAIGQRVVSYVAPGGDSLYMPEEDVQKLYSMGFIDIPSADTDEDGSAFSYGLCPRGLDYTWAMTEEDYEERLERAQKDFLDAVKTRSEWSFLFHDHFTRAAYNDGIVLKWLDEFLSWLNSLEEYNVKYATFKEYYQKFNPGFSTIFD